MAYVLLGLLILGCISIIVMQEILDKTSMVSMWLWCRKHQLRLQDGVYYCYVISSTESEQSEYIDRWGVDSNGNIYYRGKDDVPVLIDPKTQRYIYDI